MTQTKKLTVQEGLNELKILDSRIEQKIYQNEVVGVEAKGKLIIPLRSKATVDEFKKESDANLQSIVDLIAYRRALKSAILMSNGKTKVTINDVKMTVAEAIEFKSSIALEWSLVKSLSNAIGLNEVKVSQHNQRIDSSTESKIEMILGNDKDNKGDKDLIQSIEEKAEGDKASIVTPKIGNVDVEKYIKEKTEALESFQAEVDFKLTSANVLTKITVTW